MGLPMLAVPRLSRLWSLRPRALAHPAAGDLRGGSPDVASPPARGWSASLSSLRYRDYRLLWLGMVVMGAGQWLQQIALSWLVFDMTGSAAMLGLINGVRFLPFLFTSLIGGVLADRMDRRRLMLWTQWYLLAVTLLMGLLLVSGRAAVWQLFV